MIQSNNYNTYGLAGKVSEVVGITAAF